jgi:membrane-bound lytic murein transglycosylase A
LKAAVPAAGRAARLAAIVASLGGALGAALLSGCQGLRGPAAAPAPLPPAQVVFERADDAPLPAIADEDWLAAWPAWQASCHALSGTASPHRKAWEPVCTAARSLQPGHGEQVRDFFLRNLDRYRVKALEGPALAQRDQGRMTGYYEPEIEGSRERAAPYLVPVYRAPATVPTAPRAELEAPGRLDGAEIAWVRDPMEAYFLEVQGSGRIHLPDGRWLRLGYAASNGQPYRSIGRWLVDQGELAADEVSMQTIVQWAHAHPQRLHEMLDQNPRRVFFRELPASDDAAGPVGALGVPLTPGVSVAIDPRFLPLGAPLLLRTVWPDTGAPLERLALAQDTGAAIHGPLRVDWFWGRGDAAGRIAGRQRALGTVELLVPRGIAPRSLLSP